MKKIDANVLTIYYVFVKDTKMQTVLRRERKEINISVYYVPDALLVSL